MLTFIDIVEEGLEACTFDELIFLEGFSMKCFVVDCPV
jgi:hypothetical protein